jgi:uncharacterized protein YbjQ (UPF0145 family)
LAVGIRLHRWTVGVHAQIVDSRLVALRLLDVSGEGGRWGGSIRYIGIVDYFQLTRGGCVIVTSSCDLPGYRIEQVIGPVFGLTVRSRNAFSQAGAGFKSMFGGELKGMTKNLEDSRSQVIERMEAKAEELGANAVVAFRFDTSDMGGTWTEICAYGTAVVAALLSA